SRSGWRSASESASFAGHPSTTAPIAPPCDSPHVVTRKMVPNELAIRRQLSRRGPRGAWSIAVNDGERRDSDTLRFMDRKRFAFGSIAVAALLAIACSGKDGA